MATTMKGVIGGGGLTISASPAKKKGQVYIAKGSAPWYNDKGDGYFEWSGKSKITNVDKSVSGQVTVTCKDVTNTQYMFYLCFDLTSLDLSNFDTSKVTNMGFMFYSCQNITSIDLSNFDTSNVVNMSSMFSVGNAFAVNTSALASLDLSSFNTSKVTDMNCMFAFCDKLTTLDLSNFDTSNVTDMGYMFAFCDKLTTIKGVIDMKSCTKYEGMFNNCPKLTNVKIKNPPSGFNGAGLSSSQYTIVS